MANDSDMNENPGGAERSGDPRKPSPPQGEPERQEQPDRQERPERQERPARQERPGRPRPEGRPENKQRAGEGRRHGQPRDARQGMAPRHPRGQSQRQRLAPPVRSEEPPKSTVTYNCAICGKPIFDLASALGNRETGEPIHFDCALEKICAEEKLAENEKIVYLGAGFFAVVVYRNGKEGAFTVSRKIRWEGENDKQAWRKDLSSYISRL